MMVFISFCPNKLLDGSDVLTARMTAMLAGAEDNCT